MKPSPSTLMEGFDPDALDDSCVPREKGLRGVVVLPLGYRQEEGDWPANLKKVRQPTSKSVTEVR